MASHNEEKERRRQAREQAEAQDRKAERKRLVLGYAVAGLISLAVVVGIVVVIAGGGGGGGGAGGDSGGGGDRLNRDFGILPKGVTVDDREAADAPGEGSEELEAAAEAANCELMVEQRDEGNTHLDPNDPEPNYVANPPTSGNHSPAPLADGAFTATPSPLNFVHALEHGRVEIQYSSKLSEAEQLELLGLYDEDPAGMIVFPNDDQPFEITATAWRQTMGCESYDGEATLDAIRAFRDRYRGRGPEAIALQ